MPKSYIVQSGDTLFKIAKQFGTSVNAIAQANNIATPSLIKAGQTLTIPDAGVLPAQPAQPAAPPAPPAPSQLQKPEIKGPPYPRLNLSDPCAQDSNNLIRNGSMGPGHHDHVWGTVVDEWEPFVLTGTPPNFRWVDNEQIDLYGSQQLFSYDTFDAGIRQTVSGLRPGHFYHVRWGYALAAKSYDGPNVRVQTIGRKLGVDPYGGTDPQSANVVWGPDLFDGKAALNRPEMQMIFSALADQATIFLRARAIENDGGENRVWMDAICMEERVEILPLEIKPPQPAPSPAPVSPPSKDAGAAAPQPTPGGTTYTVQAGDTLFGIARKFGVSVPAIRAANNLANPNLIKPGQVLKIPK